MKKRSLLCGLWLFCTVSIMYGQESYRDRLIRPETVMDTIGVQPGMIVGEAGAGRGYFTLKLAGRVGKEGRIYANDISSSALKEIKRRAKNKGFENIQTVLGEVDDPQFPEQNLDLVFMIAAFHDFEQPVAWLKNVKRFMKPDAPLVIVEKDPDRWDRGWDHHMTREEILTVAEQAGFVMIRVDTFLTQDNIYLFEPLASEKNE